MSGYRLQVKAILLKEGVEDGPKEIRRFRVEEEEGEESGGERGGQLLRSLLRRVYSVFNVDSRTQQCTLYWKDDDGDLVQFSTGGELIHALDTMQDDTFRLYVALSEGDLEESSEPGAVTERHVTFDVTPHAHCTDPGTTTRLACPGMAWGHRGHKRGKGACKMAGKMEGAKNKEFQEIRQQVPEGFRRWVRQYVRQWVTQGPEAAAGAVNSGQKLPEGVSEDFPHWLHTFLLRHPSTHPEMEMEGVEGEMGEGPEGLPPVYFRWLCLFLPRFRAKVNRRARATSADSEGEQCGGAQSQGCKKKGPKCPGKHGCHGRKGGKHGARSTSSESEESDGGHKAWKKVPEEFRKYARVTVMQLHKKKGNNSENKEKATRAGLSSEVQEFVEQILLEWHAKLTNRRPRAVALEMMAGERTLPAGLEEEHFQWLCRFLVRWHRRNAGKCDVMSGWSSGETTTDDTSGEESGAGGQILDYGPWPGHRREWRAYMKLVRGRPHSMMGCVPPPFAMHAGPGFFSCPLPARCGGGLRLGAKRCGQAGRSERRQGCCKRWKEQDGAGAQGETSRVEDDVERVTEGVKNM